MKMQKTRQNLIVIYQKSERTSRIKAMVLKKQGWEMVLRFSTKRLFFRLELGFYIRGILLIIINEKDMENSLQSKCLI